MSLKKVLKKRKFNIKNKTKKFKGGVDNSPNSSPKMKKFYIKEVIDFINILKNKSKKINERSGNSSMENESIEDIFNDLNSFDIDDRANTYTGTSMTLRSMMYLTLIDEYGKEDCMIEDHLVLGFRIQYPYASNNELNNTEVMGICDGLLQCLERSEKKIFIIPFSFGLGNKSHTNILIYRVFDKYHQLDHYEPHGGQVIWHGSPSKNNELNDEITKTLTTLTEKISKEAKIQVKYVNATNICPINQIGIQARHQKKSTQKWHGFCTLWSILIAELTLVAPNYTTKEIYDCFNESAYNSTELDYIVKGYLITLDERLRKYGNEFEELGYLESLLSLNYSKKLVERIVKLKKLWYQKLSIRIQDRDNLIEEKIITKKQRIK
jgi:hypothetical protein